ncbi:MAG: PhzF family phenazine biosynthesis protein [Thermoanaerobaculia bacterium]
MRILQVDAFTAEPFGGNPAAVCFLDQTRDDRWMQSVAAEMNLSETAFLLPAEDGWSLRWMTPQVEVDLCGHATLASAHALWDEKLLGADAVARFHTRSGLLTARRDAGWIELDFPATTPAPCAAPAGMFEALGLSGAKNVLRSRFDVLIEVDSEETVRRLKPDFARLRSVEARGVIVTSRSASAGVDFVSRFFAPAVGVDEDPVTGSAHCALTPYWQQAGLGKDGWMNAFQASARGGILRVSLQGDRVKLQGQAVTILRGELVA